jgi:NAD(P)-dependent dehydrogenase (short-subunit alcohol dehydrogenase family)
MDIKDQVAIATGASSGTGFATARNFCSQLVKAEGASKLAANFFVVFQQVLFT